MKNTATNSMGTLEFEAIQKASIKKLDCLGKKASALILNGRDADTVMAQRKAIQEEMAALYADYKAGRAISRISSPNATTMASFIPRWN